MLVTAVPQGSHRQAAMGVKKRLPQGDETPCPWGRNPPVHSRGWKSSARLLCTHSGAGEAPRGTKKPTEKPGLARGGGRGVRARGVVLLGAFIFFTSDKSNKSSNRRPREFPAAAAPPAATRGRCRTPLPQRPDGARRPRPGPAHGTPPVLHPPTPCTPSTAHGTTPLPSPPQQPPTHILHPPAPTHPPAP